MSLEFFAKDNRPGIVSTDFVLYRFVIENDRVRVDYVIEGGNDDWMPLFSFSEDDYLLMSSNKFRHEGRDAFGILIAPNETVEEEKTDSIVIREET